MRNVLVAAVLLALLPFLVFAAVGVGVGVGKITYEEPLRPGGIYDLPLLPVLNTGNEVGDYEVGVEYSADTTRGLQAPREWFSFDPPIFYLEPGQARTVVTRLTLPVDAEPAKYFVYLQARISKKSESNEGGAKIGVAAATKLSFHIVPANLFQALRWRAADLFDLWKPWSYIIPILIAGGIAFAIFRRFVSLNLQFSTRKRPQRSLKPRKRTKRPSKSR